LKYHARISNYYQLFFKKRKEIKIPGPLFSRNAAPLWIPGIFFAGLHGLPKPHPKCDFRRHRLADASGQRLHLMASCWTSIRWSPWFTVRVPQKNPIVAAIGGFHFSAETLTDQKPPLRFGDDANDRTDVVKNCGF
jgi:hypothetical protein